MSDGGTAQYDVTASTTTSLVIATTVAAGEQGVDLLVTGLALGAPRSFTTVTRTA